MVRSSMHEPAGDDKKQAGSSMHGPAAPSSPSGFKRRVRCRGEPPGTRVVSPTMDDGFAWRKYGEKTINHHSYPRFYFCCTYRDEHGCGAKKRVQQAHGKHALGTTHVLSFASPAGGLVESVEGSLEELVTLLWS
ncbi:hypothetical protein PR202_gb01571 [Eleusine coracana subsp. coracana]|uniref:WRKY domain-containing protein n=1 Tax=Eleusine coracana subsp. coracana TaxID=191504 RepID=A0AAV5DWK1_ELECO|nr:hypothetical protein PR202_gb01571 [Eleusine coracana subsp. coracana]